MIKAKAYKVTITDSDGEYVEYFYQKPPIKKFFELYGNDIKVKIQRVSGYVRISVVDYQRLFVETSDGVEDALIE